ncbi:MAG: hypothetical protein RL139_345 [Gemmatimonadota bacterium]|jgi:predicted RNA-binding Zn ribbon-like protein
MLVPEDLLRFIRAHHDEPTLSVYVEAAPHDPASRRAWRVHLKKGIHTARKTIPSSAREERETFDRCAAAVLARIPDGDSPPATTGWACFSAANGETIARALPEVRESSVTWARGPRVVPYLRVATEGSALVVLMDREHARIGRWRDMAFEPLATMMAEEIHGVGPHSTRPPQVGFHTGTRGVTATDEEQRLRAEAANRLLGAVRHKVPLLVHAHEPILIGGASESTTALIHSLPPQLQSRCQLVPGLTVGTQGGDLASALHEALVELASAQREARITELREQAHHNGRAALGLGPTQAAADFGALAELIFSERAWHEHPAAIEHLVEQALLEGAAVQVAPASGALLDGDADGVIAGLRFPLPSMKPSTR